MGKSLKTIPKKHVAVGNESGSKSLRKTVGRRWKSGTVAKREIARLQKSTDFLLKKAPVRRLIAEIAADYGEDIRFTKDAKLAIQEAVEAYAVERFMAANIVALQGSKKPVFTLKPRHTKTANDVANRYPGKGVNTQFAERDALGIKNPYLETRPRKERKKRSKSEKSEQKEKSSSKSNSSSSSKTLIEQIVEKS